MSPDAVLNSRGPSAEPPVLVGVDGSDDSRRALIYALRVARLRDVDLLIVHAVDDAVLAGAWGVVYDPTLLQQAGEAVIDDAIAAAVEWGFDRDRLRSDVVMGNPAGVLSRMSEEAALLVVGRRSVRGLERLFVGSTSVGVAASASCPVIMVSAETNVDETGGLHVIGVGIEPHPESQTALEQAFIEARRREAGLRVIHAWGQPAGLFARQLDHERLGQLGRAAEANIAAMVEPMKQKFPDVRVEVAVVQAQPVDELVGRSKDLDLLLMGVNTSGLGGVGAVVRGVMAHARCPLELVRHQRR